MLVDEIPSCTAGQQPPVTALEGSRNFADAEANKFEINPVSGADLEAPVKDVYRTPPEVVKKAAAMVR